MAVNVARYDRIKKRDLSDFNSSSIKTFVPKPTDRDYSKGYIKRYFAQKINDTNSIIYELSEFNYNTLSNNPFYLTISLDWRISGEPTLVKETNFKSVKYAAKTMKNLLKVLPNYLQFIKK
jgi:hypothetical protein